MSENVPLTEGHFGRMRRTGKTTFLRQLLEERRAEVPPERALYLSFDDERLATLEVDQLGWVLCSDALSRSPHVAMPTTRVPHVEVMPAHEWLLAAPRVT